MANRPKFLERTNDFRAFFDALRPTVFDESTNNNNSKEYLQVMRNHGFGHDGMIII